MILIDKNINTKTLYLRLTLTEEYTGYLLEITSKATGEVTNVVINDISNTPVFQKFTISNLGLDLGDYDYVIYEVITGSIDKTNAVSILSKGLLRVIDSGDSSYELNNNSNFVFYAN